MSDSRSAILRKVKQSLGRTEGSQGERRAVEERIATHERNLVPARSAGDAAARTALFVAMAEEASATVARVAHLGEVAPAIAFYLRRENLPAELAAAPDPLLDRCGWEKEPILSLKRGPTRGDDEVSVTGAFAAVAETGTLMLLSGPDSPTTLNFLPETHIVVLPESRICGPFEDAWDRLRAARGQAGMPRTVNFVTGPSRSADIEQKLQMGAHGPRRLHIVLVAGAADDGPPD